MENQFTAAQPQSMGSRVMNAFASPAEAFEGITTLQTKTSLWLVPMLISMLVAVVFAFVVSSSSTLKGQIIEVQKRAIEERVAVGKMTQEQADRASQGMESMGMMFAVFGALYYVVILAAYYFLGTLILWLIGKFFLKASSDYSTFLAMYGTASWIAILGTIVSMLMTIGLDSIYARPNAGLAVFGNFDPMNTTHRLLSKIDLFSLWQTVVIGVGMSKLSNKPMGAGIGVAFALLVAWIAISVWLGIGG